MFGQNEAYDLQTDTWEPYTLMLMPRHGLGAVAIDAAADVAGGGPIMGDSMQSAMHEAYMLG